MHVPATSWMPIICGAHMGWRQDAKKKARPTVAARKGKQPAQRSRVRRRDAGAHGRSTGHGLRKIKKKGSGTGTSTLEELHHSRNCIGALGWLGLAWPSLATLLPLVAVVCSLRSWTLCTPTDRQHRMSRALMTSLRRQFPTAKLVFRS